MNDLLQMKNNLIQNFYVIGIPFEEIINVSILNRNDKSFDIYVNPTKSYSPKIISKFPPTNNNINKILDEFVINHCFPNEIKIKEEKYYNNHKYHFEFELDNQLFNYIENNKSLYSKIHFTCLKFYEPIKDYKKLKEHIFNKIKEEEKEEKIENMNNHKNEKNDNLNINEGVKKEKNDEVNKAIYFIPKVICFGSLLPFPDELSKILINIYEFYKYQKSNFNKENFDFYPIEKLVEQIVMSLPLPISNNNEIILSFDFEYDSFDIKKHFLPFTNINFMSYDLRDYYLNKSYNLSMIELFNYFSEENIVKIFKHIILENPILFFCENKEILSNIIEGFLNILSPFRYVLPYITILPFKYFGLIHSQDKFIFGINKKYTENFFVENEINLNKNIIVVTIGNSNNNITKIEEVSKKNDSEKINIYINQEDFEINYSNNLTEIDLPPKHKKKLLLKLKNYMNIIRKNFKEKKIEKTYVFNNKIRHIFHKFFMNILSGYTKFLLKCPDHKYFGYSIRHKYNGKNGLTRYLKEIFDIDEFISNFPKETQMFYKAFFNTELFFNFIRGVIYPNNEIDSLKHKYFDLLTFLKKNKDLRKQENFKEQYERHKKPFEPNKIPNKKKIIISNKYYFIDEEKKILMDKNKQNEALMKYGQLIELKNKKGENNNKLSEMVFSIRYFLFPKLLFDNEFFKIDYNSQFYRHYIELPNQIFIQDLNKSLITSEKDYILNFCSTIYPRVINSKTSNLYLEQNNTTLTHSNSNNSQNIPFELYIHNYIEFNWLLLLSCSLWYCNSNKEKEMRINKIFNIIEKLDYIEEQVLYFIFISLYKYSNIGQFIRIFEFLYRFIGSYEYTNLLYLFKKLHDISKEENYIENIGSDKENVLLTQKRSFLDIKKYINNEEIDDKLKEEIIFESEQTCGKCQSVINFGISEISDIINRKIDKNKNKFTYKCKKCGFLNSGINIKYNIILNNIKKNKEEVVAKGNFDLIMPYILYEEIKNYVIGIKDNNIDIDHIFTNQNINLLNYIFYFSLNCLPFDFLIPYENNDDKKSNRDYFNPNNYLKNEENINDKSHIKFMGLSSINNYSLCLSGNKN